jgi:hypothetical protein
VENSKSTPNGDKFEIGDVIGMSMDIAPPHKYPNKQEVNEGSEVIFYRNGSEICRFSSLKQDFYCAAISLYNFARVEVRTSA